MPVKNIIPGQTVTKEKLQRVKELRREMTPAEKTAERLAGITRPPPPASRNTSPKYDDVNFESTFRLFLVVFGGGRVGARDSSLTFIVTRRRWSLN